MGQWRSHLLFQDHQDLFRSGDSQRLARLATRSHPETSIRESRRPQVDADCPRNWSRVQKIHLILTSGIKQAALLMAHGPPHALHTDRHTGQLKLLNRKLTGIPEFEVDAVRAGTTANKFQRTGHLTLSLLQEETESDRQKKRSRQFNLPIRQRMPSDYT